MTHHEMGKLKLSQYHLVALFDCPRTLCYLQEFPLPECLPLVAGNVRSQKRGEETVTRS